MLNNFKAGLCLCALLYLNGTNAAERSSSSSSFVLTTDYPSSLTAELLQGHRKLGDELAILVNNKNEEGLAKLKTAETKLIETIKKARRKHWKLEKSILTQRSAPEEEQTKHCKALQTYINTMDRHAHTSNYPGMIKSFNRLKTAVDSNNQFLRHECSYLPEALAIEWNIKFGLVTKIPKYEGELRTLHKKLTELNVPELRGFVEKAQKDLASLDLAESETQPTS